MVTTLTFPACSSSTLENPVASFPEKMDLPSVSVTPTSALGSQPPQTHHLNSFIDMTHAGPWHTAATVLFAR